MSDKEICCICRKYIEIQASGFRYGHNAEPVMEGRCCDDCNRDVVLTTRIRYAIGRRKAAG